MDLEHLEHNTRDGLHIASLAGTWTALVAGFGGLRVCRGHLSFAPRLPAELHRLAFSLVFQNRRLRVEVTAQAASYSLLEGETLALTHHREKIMLSPHISLTRPIPYIQPEPRPTQPKHRAPSHRQRTT